MAEALSAFTRATVIEDDDAVARCPADAVVVGADAVTPTAVVNKVKTGLIAASAREHGIPCFVLAGETKLLPFEPRFADPFERTDLGLFSAVAVPAGLLEPGAAAGRARSVDLHPDVLRLAAALGETDHYAGERTS